jgi:O-antigen/teichoic acid export membrane protein
MQQKSKHLNKDSIVIFKNFSYLTALKGINIGFKFLLLAYLIRVLGDKNYGLVTWLDSIIQYFLMVINFGFNIYAAKYIVDHKEDNDKINEIVSSIFIIKGILFVGSIIAVIGLGFLNEFNNYRELLFLFIFCGIGEVLFPIWYFQGKENLKPATFIVFISRLVLVIGTLIFVNSNHDALIYILLLVISSLIMGFMGAVYIFKHNKVKFIRIKVKIIKFYFKESFPFFLGRFLSLVFNFGTIFLIGMYYELEQVSGFDLSLKIILLGVIPFEMLQQAVFPTLARTKNKKLLKNLILASFIIGCLIGVCTYFLAETFILLFGGESMIGFVSTLKTLSIMSPFISLTFILGTCSLVAFGYFKEYNFSLICTSIIYFIILIILFYLDLISFWNLIYLRIFGDVLMCFIRGYFTMKRKILTI